MATYLPPLSEFHPQRSKTPISRHVCGGSFFALATYNSYKVYLGCGQAPKPLRVGGPQFLPQSL